MTRKTFIVEYSVKKSTKDPLIEGFHQYSLSDMPNISEQKLMKMNVLFAAGQTQSQRHFGNIKTFNLYTEEEFKKKLDEDNKNESD